MELDSYGVFKWRTVEFTMDLGHNQSAPAYQAGKISHSREYSSPNLIFLIPCQVWKKNSRAMDDCGRREKPSSPCPLWDQRAPDKPGGAKV